MKIAYSKTYQTPAQLVALLKHRGLEIYNQAKAESYLKRIGYYRLSGYWYPFLQEPKSLHIFKPKSTFEGALSLYHFDRRLRLLVFNEIEKIEVAVRAAIANIMANETNDPFWITNSTAARTSSVVPTASSGPKRPAASCRICSAPGATTTGGGELAVTAPGYLRYVRVWNALWPLRRIYYRLRGSLRSRLSKIGWLRKIYHQLHPLNKSKK